MRRTKQFEARIELEQTEDSKSGLVNAVILISVNGREKETHSREYKPDKSPANIAEKCFYDFLSHKRFLILPDQIKYVLFSYFSESLKDPIKAVNRLTLSKCKDNGMIIEYLVEIYSSGSA